MVYQGPPQLVSSQRPQAPHLATVAAVTTDLFLGRPVGGRLSDGIVE